ncbi:YpoC family protein [Planococcus sp. NCCP-2050]|uniref:YpoC family protein n=1 Tax=Planococcus sp. NCCP-2050 TaxID=2944679 RepID=UPI00203B5BDA|nr:hypothetical protein [Planococcus sp. NCCP-2050]GKW44721.1 hypothetical protein NCCP2050_04130 [Planococcus sp. NCCP-2050]
MKLSQKLTKESVSPYFDQWAVLTAEISSLHQNRSNQTAAQMLQGLELFKALLAHCENQILPMNGHERIHFIEQHLANYAAFRQLDELFSEMKKKIAAKRIQMKNGLV